MIIILLIGFNDRQKSLKMYLFTSVMQTWSFTVTFILKIKFQLLLLIISFSFDICFKNCFFFYRRATFGKCFNFKVNNDFIFFLNSFFDSFKEEALIFFLNSQEEIQNQLLFFKRKTFLVECLWQWHFPYKSNKPFSEVIKDWFTSWINKSRAFKWNLNWNFHQIVVHVVNSHH